MARPADIIRKAIEEARRDFVNYTLAQEYNIYVLFEQASNQLAADIARITRQGMIPPARLGSLLNQVKAEMDRLRPRLRGLIRTSQKNSIDYGIKSSIIGASAVIPNNFKAGIGSSYIDKLGKVHRYDPRKELYSASMWGHINGQAMDALVRTQYGGITFSRRVWDATWPAERQIRNQINLAVLTGKSAGSVARNIKGYLGIPETFRGTALKDFHPGAGVYKSAYKNSTRLAGTEINRAFNEGVIRYGKVKSWVTGFIWRTSSGNPCPICTDEETNFFPKEDPPTIPAHPFCMCYLEIVYEGV